MKKWKYNKYQTGKLKAMKYLDYAYTLFENLEDTDNEYVVEAACYFIQEYGFDYQVLPQVLYDCVVERLFIHSKLEYEESSIT